MTSNKALLRQLIEQFEVFARSYESSAGKKVDPILAEHNRRRYRRAKIDLYTELDLGDPYFYDEEPEPASNSTMERGEATGSSDPT